MAEWTYTAQYDYMGSPANVSEFIHAETEEAAQRAAASIRSLYLAAGRPLRNERLVLSRPMPSKVSEGDLAAARAASDEAWRELAVGAAIADRHGD